MSRIRFSEPGAIPSFLRKGVLIRVGGKLTTLGKFGKGLREERGINGRIRRRHSNLLEPDLVAIVTDFREAIAALDIEGAVASGKVSVIVNSAAANELEAELAVSISQHLEAALADGVEVGLRFGGTAVAGVPAGFVTEAAVAAVERSASLAALDIAQAARAGIAEILKLGVTDQLAPVQVAQKVGQLAGLTPQQVKAVENFRTATTSRLVPTGEALTPQVQAVIDDEVEQYRQRSLLNRGRTISENEIQAAVTQGEAAFWDEAVRSGEVDEKDVFKTWRTVQDAKVCVICEPLHGQTIPIKSQFITIVGPKDGSPAHPRCRCFMQYGEVGPGGIVPSRPDRGPAALEQQRAERLLDPEAVRQDLQIARLRNDRFAGRLGKVRPGTKREANIRGAIGSNADTIASLEARLRDLGEPQ